MRLLRTQRADFLEEYGMPVTSREGSLKMHCLNEKTRSTN